MRGIRLKAFIKTQKIIKEVDAINFTNGYVFCDGVKWYFSEIELMQYIGIEDEDGEEIYDDYIVKFVDEYDGRESIHKVEYCSSNGYPAFELSPLLDCESNGFAYVYQGGGGTLKVIGNIHQNPELIDKT